MRASNLPAHCTPTTSFLSTISATFETCVPTPLALLSTLLGILSIISWLCAQLPQIFKNYILGSASGLSVYFLAVWLLGDATNLLGALLTRQEAWQVVIAGYYVTVDVALVCQFIWYSNVKPLPQESLVVDTTRTSGEGGDGSSALIVPESRHDAKISSTAPETEGKAKSSTEPRSVKSSPFRLSQFSFPVKEKSSPSSSYRYNSNPSNTVNTFGPSPKSTLFVTALCAVLCHASPLHLTEDNAPAAQSSASDFEVAGRILSWISTTCYLGSRLPQIYKNARRQSTSGLSPALFIAAFFGNLFYSSSLLTNPLGWASYPPYGLHGWVGPEGSDRAEWVSLAAPFWLGAAGVLALDATVGVQFLIYGEENKVLVVRDSRGRGRWRKVTGWMRGWIPSPSPTRLGSREDERPLLAGDDRPPEIYGAA